MPINLNGQLYYIYYSELQIKIFYERTLYPVQVGLYMTFVNNSKKGIVVSHENISGLKIIIIVELQDICDITIYKCSNDF